MNKHNQKLKIYDFVKGYKSSLGNNPRILTGEQNKEFSQKNHQQLQNRQEVLFQCDRLVDYPALHKSILPQGLLSRSDKKQTRFHNQII